jgi:hypothetical protein
MPETVVCTYRVETSAAGEFREVVSRHFPALLELGLVLPEPRMLLESLKPPDKPVFVEVFAWRDQAAIETAHSHPKVLAVWERMGPLCEARDGLPAQEFPHYRSLL